MAAKIPRQVAAKAMSTAPIASHRHASNAPTDTTPASASCAGFSTAEPKTKPSSLAGMPTVTVSTASVTATAAAEKCASMRTTEAADIVR